MEITSPTGKCYVIGNELGETKLFKFYQCTTGDNKACILKIARKAGFNGLLDREAFLLQTLEKEASDLETLYQKKNSGERKLNYHFFFPKLIETFISEEQGGSRISIVSFAHIANDISELTPLNYLTEKEEIRVDPRTSAWILGKLLTMLAFAQDQNVSSGNLNSDNIFINRAQHYVTIFDWTAATLGSGKISKDLTAANISKLTREVILVLGGNLATKKLPADKQLEGNDYEKYLWELNSGLVRDVVEAHSSFYDIVLSAWPREFYEFKSYCLTKKMED
jgi:hypothetical protein